MNLVHAIHPEGLPATVDTWKTFCFRLLELSPASFPDNPDKQKRYSLSVDLNHFCKFSYSIIMSQILTRSVDSLKNEESGKTVLYGG